MKGYGQILRVDLGNGAVERENIPVRLVERFLGGMGINDWLLWEHFLKVDPFIDPRSSDNVLIVGVGPLGGTGYGLGTKAKWTFKSPATGFFGDSSTGGNFGAQLRWAGYDQMVITGKASSPVYLWIDDDKVEIRDARHLWGKKTDEATEMLKSEIGDPDVGVACIGPAGENQVANGSIICDKERVAARTGGGCVFGSKNLKAVVIRGTRGVAIYDPKGFLQSRKRLYDQLDKAAMSWVFKGAGTLSTVAFYDQIGGNAYKNNLYSKVPDEEVALLKSNWFSRNLDPKRYSCSPGCAIGCAHWFKVKGDETPGAHVYKGKIGTRPEYLGVASFAMGCAIPDLISTSLLQRSCNEYGLDLVELGAACAFLMELWEKGIITADDTIKWFGSPIEFDWGNVEVVKKVILSIALQDNEFGRLFRDGAYRAAVTLSEVKGSDLLRYLVYGKGGNLFLEELRPFPMWALGAGVASRGADHLKTINIIDKSGREDISMSWLGRPEAGKMHIPDRKGAGTAYAENCSAAINLLGVCVFMWMLDPLTVPLSTYCDGLRAVTGIEISDKEFVRIGERAVNMEKAFNSRLGLTKKDDKINYRWLGEPVTSGPAKGIKAEDYYQSVLTEYYEFHGWDADSGLQKDSTLRDLELDDVVTVLAKDGVVVT